MPEKSSPVAPVQNFVHTPEPWKCERLIDNTGNPYATLYECHIDLGPCMIWAPPGNAEQEANARLIAAAPRLLDALIEIADDYADRFDLNSKSTNPGIKTVIEEARHAIALATGKVV